MAHRILVVEDSPTQAAALGALLEQAGYEVEVAPTAEAALERLAAVRHDAVLSDIVMPGLSGYDLCRRIKSDPELATVPVVLLTSLVDPIDIVRGLECGADNYITKPYEADHLIARIRHVLDNRHTRRTARASLGVTIRFLGNDFTINSDREQILDLFLSSIEDVVRTNEALQQSQQELAEAHAQLELYAQAKAREAQESVERYQALMQNAGDAIFVLDSEGRILESNARAVALLGRDTDEIAGCALDDFLVDEQRPDFRVDLANLRTRGPVEPREWRLRTAGGMVTDCEISASVSAYHGEQLVLVIVRDISDRKQAEVALHDAHQRLEALINSAPTAIIALDRDFRVQLWNPAAERLFGWSADEVLAGGALSALLEDQTFARLSERLRNGESLAGIEVRGRHSDGALVDISISAAPLYDANGAFDGVMAVVEDTSERRRAEDALRQSIEVERANRAKNEFLSRMSHELRTPLNAILGFGQLLESEERSADDKESVEQILRAGRHLLSLIDEVLDLAKIEAGRISLSIEPVSVTELIEQAAGLVRPVAAQRGITLQPDTRLAADVWVDADLQRLKQVLLNFLSNAIKYNRPSGSVRISSVTTAEGRVRVQVRDTGPGIPADKLERLFTPFDRLGAEHLGVEGTGLGLALSKGLVEAMGGRVGVESQAGEGSTFWVELPRSASTPEDVSIDQPPVAVSGAIATTGERRVVLYIEDNLSNLRLVERVLAQRPELTLVAAMQASLGLELAREHHPDLVLLDLNLPDLPGEEVLERLKAHPTLQSTPVVVISADALPSQIDRLLAAGVHAYLTKPLDVRKFLSVVDSVLELEPS